jgi:membrane fusion protein (multidrug efflux system)
MTSEVRPQVSGIIRERLFEEGADVEAGQMLYRIDPALFEAAHKSAKANLARAEATENATRLLAERYSKIIKSNAVSMQEHDDAVSGYIQAQASVEAARKELERATINLGYTKVLAPVSGRISRSYVTPGALVTANQPQPLVTIQHMDTVYVDITQSSTELLRLRRSLAQGGDMSPAGADAAKVRLWLEDGTPYTGGRNADGTTAWIEGDLLFADVTIEKGTGVVNIRAKFPNPDNILLPGMYVRAVIEEGIVESAVLVPQRAVLRDANGNPYVYVLDKDEGGVGRDTFKVARRPVVIQRNVGNRWLLSSGLAPGDKVMIEGHLKTRPGAVVSGIALSRITPESTAIMNAGRAHAVPVR